jgi:hypothetical protein
MPKKDIMWDIFESIDQSDLQTLISAEKAESRDLEYKREFPGKADGDKIPFLAQISAFANTVGGRLLIGMEAEKGVAKECLGIDIDNPDQSLLTLEQIIRTGLSPVVVGIRIKYIKLANGKFVIIIDIPKSYAGPHCVTARDHGRFYARNSGGKYVMDVSELRRAFNDSEDAANRIRQFRLDRITSIIADETPIPLMSGCKGILHLVPFDAPRATVRVNVIEIDNNLTLLRPLGASRWDSKLNLDGVVSFAGPREMAKRTYTQIYRNGVIEAVQTFTECEGRKIIPGSEIECDITEGVQRYLSTMSGLGLPCPIYVFYSMSGVKNYELPKRHGLPPNENLGRCDRDVLIFPELVIQNYDVNFKLTLRPLLDMMWNAFGYEGSPNFDKVEH